MTLAIVGSAELTAEQVAAAKFILAHVFTRYQPTKVVSGGAPGIDTLAERAARYRGIEFEKFLPAEKNWERGFKPRNIKIAEACDQLVRIVSSTAKTYGSGWTRDYAEDIGKPTEEFTV